LDLYESLLAHWVEEVCMKHCFGMVPIQNRPVRNRPVITDHSKQTTFITDPFITDLFNTDHFHNTPCS